MERWLAMARRPTSHNRQRGQHRERTGLKSQAEREVEQQPSPQESGPSNALTPIHRGIHCSATQDATEEISELDQMAIDNFIDTLAEIALAVAQRSSQQAQNSGEIAA